MVCEETGKFRQEHYLISQLFQLFQANVPTMENWFLLKWNIGLKWIKHISKENHCNKTWFCFFFKNRQEQLMQQKINMSNRNKTFKQVLSFFSNLISTFFIFQIGLYTRRNFSLVARNLLKFTRCSLLVIKSLVTRCKICSLLVAEVLCCKKSLVTRRKIRSLLVAEVALCKKPLVTHYRSCSL